MLVADVHREMEGETRSIPVYAKPIVLVIEVRKEAQGKGNVQAVLEFLPVSSGEDRGE